MGNDGSKTSVMVICPDLVACVEVKDIHTICPVEAAKKIAEYLKLDKTSLNDPPDEIVKKCRTLCIYLKAKGRLDIVKRLKTKLPSGVTGPCLDENGLYEELNYDIRLHLTQSLCGEEQWKRLANEVGISNSRLSYFNKKDNPAEAVLEEYCKASRLTVGDLYDMLIKCSAAALADEYL